MSENAPPRLMLIGDRFTDPDRAERIMEAVSAGVRWVQLRDHRADEVEFERAARRMIDRARALAPGVWISLNGQPESARRWGVGVHAGRWMAEPWTLPGSASHRTGSSVHALAEARAAREAGQAYVLYSPIFPTASKPGHPGVGVAALADVCASVGTLPVYALGGITPERVGACLEAGAAGVAVLSGILRAPDVGVAVEWYHRVLTEASNP